MKFKRSNTWAVSIILLVLFTVVLLFPIVSDNEELYKIVLYTAIGIVFFIVIAVVGIHLYNILQPKKRVTE